MLITLRYNLYFGRDSSKSGRWPGHHRSPAQTPFDEYMVEQREIGNIHYVLYFEDSKFDHFSHVLEPLLNSIPRVADMPNTWNIVNGEMIFKTIDHRSVNTELIMLMRLHYHLYFRRDASKGNNWPGHHNKRSNFCWFFYLNMEN